MVSVASKSFRRLRVWVALATVIGLMGCAHVPGRTARYGGNSGAAHGQVPGGVVETRALTDDLIALAPTVQEEEAGRVAASACDSSRRLAREYRVIRPAWLHNFLVNVGIRSRGLCYQWAEDLQVQLQKQNLSTLQLHWGIARAGTPREHNCVVVTARDQPFDQGIVLDAWRRSGRLVWAPVATDKYPWVEGELAPVNNAVQTELSQAKSGKSVPRQAATRSPQPQSHTE